MRIGVAVAIALGAGRAPAQQPCLPDTTAASGGPPIVLFAALPADRGEAPELRRVRGAVLQDYAARFTRPGDISLVRAKAEALRRSSVGAGGSPLPAFAEVRFTYGTDGRYADVWRPRSTGDPRFDSALIDPVARLQAEHVAFYLPGGRDTLQMRVEIALQALPGRYPIALAQLTSRNTITRSAHIVHTDIYPAWPKEMEAKRVNDDVVVRILVDERGRPVMDSVKVIQGKHQQYIDAVLAVIPRYRWTPALSGGCAVRQWVQMPFMFHFAAAK
jgi:hypothetical protein